MKDKTLTENHFDYVNDQVKILGFKNLADFDSIIPYDKLKSSQEIICKHSNDLLIWFKKLFPQEGFDLRKINYIFVNIDQIIGFIKKLFTFMGINYNYSRIKGIPTLRLIPPNNLYKNYIDKMWNIPQNVVNTTSDSNSKQNEFINMSELYEKFTKNKLNIESILINTNILNLSSIKLDWIETINIQTNNYLPKGTTFSLLVSNEEIIIETIQTQTKNHELKLNLPNNFLYLESNIYLQINLPDDSNNSNYDFIYNFYGWEIINKQDILNDYVANSIIYIDNDKYTNLGLDMGIYKNQLKLHIKHYLKTISSNTPICIHYETLSTIKMSYLMSYLKKPFEKEYIINNLFCLSKVEQFGYFYWIKLRTETKQKLQINTEINVVIGDIIYLSYVVDNNTIFDDENYFKFNIDFPTNKFYKYESLYLNIKLPTNIINMNLNIIINGTSFKSSTPKTFNNSHTTIYFDHDTKWFIPGVKELKTSSGYIRQSTMNSNIIRIKNYSTDILSLFFNKLKQLNLLEINKLELNSEIKETGIFANIDFDNFMINFDDSNIDVFNIDFLNFINEKKYFDNLYEPNPKLKYLSSEFLNINPINFLIAFQIKKILYENNIIESENQTFSFGSILSLGWRNMMMCEIINNKDNNNSKYKIYYNLPRNNIDIIKYIEIDFKTSIDDISGNINISIGKSDNKLYDFGLIKMMKKIKLECVNMYVNRLYSEELFLIVELDKCDFDKYSNYWKTININVGKYVSDLNFRRNLGNGEFQYVQVK